MGMSRKDADTKKQPVPESKLRERRGPSKDWLGDQLRDLYGSYAEEPLPDELRSLLDRLDDDKPDGPGKGS